MSLSAHFRSGARRVVAASLACIVALVVSGCGGGGGGGGGSNSTPAATSTTAPTVTQLANICTLAGEKAWISAYMNDAYLFYRDIVAVDPNAYSTQESYFYALLVTSKDRFSFVESQASADAFFSQGADVGYGAVFKFDTANNLRIGFVDAAGPLAAQNVARGAQLVTLNGTAVGTLSTAQLNALLFPTAVGVSLSLGVIDLGQTVARTVVVSSANVVEDPVPLARVMPSDPNNPASSKVGYLLFNDHIATSEVELINAIQSFKNAGVTDVVLDIRYNGGGFLYIASELASMLGGSSITPNAVFDKLTFNDKHPEETNDPANTVGFPAVSTTGQTLPTLNLSRVFVITAPGTCSASEAVINGLTPFLNVVRIGGTTCGKPYGFIQANNCGDAFFAIQFQGVNNVGFGDFTNGFAPTCTVADDFNHALGDPVEGRLSASLAYSRNGTCPVTATAARQVAEPQPGRDTTLGRPEREMIRLR